MRVTAKTVRFAVLIIAVVATGVGVVTSRHESRRMFVELQGLEADRDELQIRWGQLQLEQATFGEAGRIESVAASELGLQRVEESLLLEIDP